MGMSAIERSALAMALCSVLSPSAVAAPPGTLEDALALATPPPPKGGLLAHYFRDCAQHESEFSRKRCEERRSSFQTMGTGRAYCSVQPAQLGDYDFKKQRFIITPAGLLSDPWARPDLIRDEGYGPTYEQFSEEADESIRELGFLPSHLFIIEGDPSRLRSIIPELDPIRSRPLSFPVTMDEADAERFKASARLYSVTVFVVKRRWSRTARTGLDKLINRVRTQAGKEVQQIDRKAARDFMRKTKPSATVLQGLGVRVVARAVVDLTSGRSLASTPPSVGGAGPGTWRDLVERCSGTRVSGPGDGEATGEFDPPEE